MSKFNKRNLTPKVLSILFALLMWIYVMGAINPRVTRDLSNIPVDLLYIDELRQEGLVLMDNEEFTVRVRLTGRRDEVYNVSLDQVRVRADLRGFRLGTNNVPVEVTAPNNVDVDYNPRFIRVELEEIVSKQKEVRVEVVGEPAEGYAMGNPQYRPTVVSVEGPESIVNSVEYVRATLNLNGERENVSVSLPLQALNSRGGEVTNVEVKTPYVDVDLQIDQMRTVTVEAVTDIQLAEGYRISNINVTPERVTLRGQADILAEIESIQTAPINISNLQEDRTVEAILVLPEGVTVVGDNDVTVTITVERVAERVFTLERDKVQFRNLANGLVVNQEAIPQTLEVTVTGPEDVVTEIQQENISIIVDLQGLDENEYTIEPIVSLPFNIQTQIDDISLNPTDIQITLSSEIDQ
ncbi:YbbR family protein [Alkaliphilus metalliredigens QYMF]|uniref:YbbR family protein n=1 Tax=Alkaliphilus metalliredigens (strain QYMF) TaxID=293826 RepID=A6TW18_ALKMQ|nr:CdaR family protein [Alkaliphilus metalliredigens]ABR50386.1 YbbR family protein [Alkaliphilus metalliredigens QYMF]